VAVDLRIHRIPLADVCDGFGDSSHPGAGPGRWIRGFIREIGCGFGHPSHPQGRWIRVSIALWSAGQAAAEPDPGIGSRLRR
jgi:hypothetical protein